MIPRDGPDRRLPGNPDTLRPARRAVCCPRGALVQSWEDWCRDAGVTPWVSGIFPERHRIIAWVPQWRAHARLAARHDSRRGALICIGARGVPPVADARERALRVLEILAFGQNDYATRETVCRLDLWGPPDETSRGPWAVEHVRCMGARERRRRARCWNGYGGDQTGG